ARPDGRPFVFAGLGKFEDVEGGIAVHVAILTREASDFMKPFHHRMPVIMPPETWDDWLDCKGTTPEQAANVRGPVPDKFLAALPVSTRGNSPSNNDAKLIEPAGRPERPSKE